MTSKILKRGALATGILIGAFALTAHAQPGERMFQRMAQKLELTAEQQASVRDIQANYRVDRETKRAMRDEIKTLIDAGNVDAAAELAASQARDAVYRRARMRSELSQVLTAEQLAKMEALREQRKHDRSRGRHRATGIDDAGL